MADADARREVELEATKTEVREVRTNLATEIDGVCAQIIKQKLKDYERVVNAFSKFFNEDELNQVLDRKADIELI